MKNLTPYLMLVSLIFGFLLGAWVTAPTSKETEKGNLTQAIILANVKADSRASELMKVRLYTKDGDEI